MRIRDFAEKIRDIETESFFLFYALSRYRFNYFSAKQIEDYQRSKAAGVVRYAFNNSKFFRNYYSGYNLNDFKSLPFINKKIMMENLTDYNTLGFNREDILSFCLEVEKSRDFAKRFRGVDVGMSSGTSGNKGVEIVTPREEMYMKAAFLSRFDMPKNEKLNVAFILRVSAPAFSLNILGHKLTYVSQLASMELISNRLQSINPNILSAPPSMLKLIAKEVEEKRLKIKPKRLITYAEIIYPDVRDYLKSVFNCPLHEIYKCTEGPIAMTCKNEKLHINEDLVLVETFNADNSPTPSGAPCEKLIITDLHKRAQPIIRYHLNDIITISAKKCSCGSNFRVIEKIQGRSDDLFWGIKESREGMQFIFPDYISRAIITSSENIDEYQAIQNSPSDIVIRIDLKDKSKENLFESEKLVKNIENLFAEYGCRKPDVKILFEKPMQNERSNKLVRIQRNFEVKE
ncbi:MAG: hypothetical protein PHW02_08230 [bacterium]|nr:hypothetical protein [bacterium]